MPFHCCILQLLLPLFLSPEPCPPGNVQANVKCQNDMAVVSWEASIGAVGYEARLRGRDGHFLTCHTNNTFCNIYGLHCGIVYYTDVMAIGQTLNSSASPTELLVAGTEHSNLSNLHFSTELNILSKWHNNTSRLKQCSLFLNAQGNIFMFEKTAF